MSEQAQPPFFVEPSLLGCLCRHVRASAVSRFCRAELARLPLSPCQSKRSLPLFVEPSLLGCLCRHVRGKSSRASSALHGRQSKEGKSSRASSAVQGRQEQPSKLGSTR